jgi:hypothetical protein
LGNLPQTKEQKLRNGANGNYDTVSVMRSMAKDRSTHPLVRLLALNILQDAKIPSHNYLDECMAIGRYVQRYVRYVKDPKGMEQLTDPILMIEKLQRGEAMGDCDDMSLLIATLLLAIGHQPYFRMVRYTELYGPYNHIYVVCYENNLHDKQQRLVLDGIVKHQPIGYELNHRSGKEVKV